MLIEHLELALRAANIGIFQIPLDKGSHRSELECLDGLDIEPDDHDRVIDQLEAFVHEKIPELVIEYRSPGNGNGRKHWRQARGSLVRDERGVPTHLVGSSLDITHLKESQEATLQLRLATRLSGVNVWSWELVGGELAGAKRAHVNAGDSLGDDPDETDDFATSLSSLVIAEDQARVFAESRACVEGKTEQFECEFRVRHEDGSLESRLARGVTERDADGRPLRFTGTSVDVTRLKRAEDDVRTAKERLDLAAKLCGLSVFEYDVHGLADPGRAPARIAAGWEERGLSGSEALAARDVFAKSITPEDLPGALEVFYAIARGEVPDGEMEFRARSPIDGSIRWRGGTVKCFLDESGAPVRVIGVSYDIQKVKAAEEEARRAAQQVRLATDLSGVGVWGYELTEDGDLAKAKSMFDNDGVMLSLGYDVDDVPSNLPARLGRAVYSEDQPRMAAELEDCFTGVKPMFDAECRFIAKDGSMRWKLVRGIVSRDASGRPLTFMGTAVDVTHLKRIQEELQRVKERLELAVLSSNACTWDYELLDGQIAGSEPVFTNAWELCGYEAPADPRVAAQAFSVVLAPGDTGPFAAGVQAFLDGTGREWESELGIVHKDGSDRLHLTRGVVTRNSNGKATRFTGASIDITDRKRMERALEQSEDRFRRTFENAAVGMVLTDLDGKFLEYNARFCEFLGYSREELQDRRFVEFMDPDEIGRDLEQQLRVTRGEIPSFTRDKRYFRKDREVVWGNITVSVIQWNADGTPVHVMGILLDITEQKALEVEIAKAQARMQLAMRGSDVAVFDADIPGGNAAVSTWTHFNMWEPMGIDPATGPTDFEGVIEHTVHPEDLGNALAYFDAAIRARAPALYLEHRVAHRDGSVRWRLTRGTFVFDEAGTLTRLIGTTSDITKLKQIEGELSRAREAAEAANRAKDEFLANVSHEIRTPMNAILGMTELALDSSPSDHQRQLLSTVRSAAKNLLGIINDLLDFSKIEAGKLTLDRASFSLRAAVGDTLRALAVRAHRKGLELLCHVRSEVPDALDGDAGRVRQVLMNLVGNAIKFTPRGEVEICVEAVPSSDAMDMSLIFTVRDTGIGIPLEKQASIFRAFEQEDSSTTRNYGGTGLGLTISAQLAELMGGGITVESASGRGSTFRFTARFARSSRSETATTSPERLADLRVLVVDDNETNRRILEEWLTSWRMQPTAVGGAEAALDALAGAHEAGTPFALVLLDARMPDSDGVTLARQIRQRWGAPAPRLVLLSSDDDSALAARSRENGVLAYLLKPVQQSELLEAIWAVMNLDLTVPNATAKAEGQPERSRALRVLVAEDNELNVALLEELLRQRGHHAEFARDGRAALELALKGTCDLMLLDLHMPELDGFEVVRAIREHERGTKRHLPTIALTARSSTRDRELCLAAGIDEFLSKPIEAAVLWAAVDRLVREWLPVRHAPGHVEPGLLDPRAVLRTFGGQASVLEKLLVVFRRSLPDQMSRIRAALADRDLVRLREAAHQLVGTVASFSTVTADLASTLEDAAVRHDLESCIAFVERLGSMCQKLLDATATLTLDSLKL